ncbi:hypothetical protein D3C72_1626190 [compost metagenome]
MRKLEFFDHFLAQVSRHLNVGHIGFQGHRFCLAGVGHHPCRLGIFGSLDDEPQRQVLLQRGADTQQFMDVVFATAEGAPFAEFFQRLPIRRNGDFQFLRIRLAQALEMLLGGLLHLGLQCGKLIFQHFLLIAE